MTPLDVVRDEVAKGGWVLKITKSDNSAVCPIHKVIVLGSDVRPDLRDDIPTDVALGVIGLHELGHIHTGAVTGVPMTASARLRFQQHLMRSPWAAVFGGLSTKTVIEVYAAELAAWAWAATKVPAGFERAFDYIRDRALATYARNFAWSVDWPKELDDLIDKLSADAAKGFEEVCSMLAVEDDPDWLPKAA